MDAYTEGPTAAKFLNSDKLGTQYVNDMFVADVHNGWIYHFDLNEYRTDLILEGPPADKIANTPEEMQETIFGEGFEESPIFKLVQTDNISMLFQSVKAQYTE
jgi:hypothetical protein